jgi:hypothetical protein
MNVSHAPISVRVLVGIHWAWALHKVQFMSPNLPPTKYLRLTAPGLALGGGRHEDRDDIDLQRAEVERVRGRD